MAIDGTWNVTMQTPIGSREVTIELAADGDALSGSLANADGAETLYEGAIEGDNLSWKVDVDTQVGRMALEFEGAVDGDAIAGQVHFGSFGSGDFSGTRAPANA
jgi:hypothetical protein